MKKILFLIFFVATVVNVYSQANDSIENRQYLTSMAGYNWFVSVGGGANIYFGEFDKHGSFTGRISYVGKLSIGKWFTPSVGFRAQFDIAGMKGFLNPYSTRFAVTDIAKNHAYGEMDADGYYREKFNYFNSHLDLLVSIFKYRENRFYHLIPYIGAGYAFRFGYGENGIHEGEFTVNTGIINRFRLSKSIDIDFETGAMFVNQRFDGSYGGQMLEGGFTATLGLNIKLGKTKTFKRPEKCDYSTYENQIAKNTQDYGNNLKKLSDDLAVAKQKITNLEQQLNAKQETEVKPSSEEQKTISKTFDAILFETGSDKIKNSAKPELDKVADILKKYSTVTVKLSGHTDSRGSISYNQQLSQQRAESVKAYLHEKGVNAVIEIAAYGEERSAATNKTSEGRAKNRRTEIEIYIK
ncbi:MAG: OmpA family protein [Prevotellaceae bacterium]|jgi:outer membrane protein OmpA-like peptidoglycan-associated protein|nr:OmpA family protein [Prevotellaceae bacterium]